MSTLEGGRCEQPPVAQCASPPAAFPERRDRTVGSARPLDRHYTSDVAPPRPKTGPEPTVQVSADT